MRGPRCNGFEVLHVLIDVDVSSAKGQPSLAPAGLDSSESRKRKPLLDRRLELGVLSLDSRSFECQYAKIRLLGGFVLEGKALSQINNDSKEDSEN